jgi:hypothetical protein
MEILKIVDIALAGLAGLMGIIVLFRNTALAWKWVALAGIIWAVMSVFRLYIPSIWDIVIFQKVVVFHWVQNLGTALCLFLGLLTVKQ